MKKVIIKACFTLFWIYLFSPHRLSAQQYQEKYRPQFHYSAPKGWVGDPCALIHYQGIYHLFTWGHAISKDLVHWQQLPWPMKGGDGSFDYFTGSMVVDKANTAGLGLNSMIAFYTINNKKTKKQSQGLSFSNDYQTFNYYPGNPVLDIGSKEFRDPQVFWYAPQKKWIMVVALAVERKVSFYSSSDLKAWQHLSDFGQIGSLDGVWECPDLVVLPVDGNSADEKWLLSVAVGPNKQQYFVGHFDGISFKLDPAIEAFLREGTGMDGVVFDGFNNASFAGNWTKTGTAFGKGPERSNAIQHLGKGYINTSTTTAAGNAATGSLTSKPFKIDKTAINFLIGGGNYEKQTCINLVVDGRIVRSSTGDSTTFLKWAGWNVADLIGKRAQIEIIDKHTGDMGHIAVDQIMFSDILHHERREHALWSEYGCDFYAAKSCRNFDDPNGRTTWLGWMSNWEYAGAVPTWGGTNNRGMESISRRLELKTFPEGIRLVQNATPEMDLLRKDSVAITNRIIEEGTMNLEEFKPQKNTYELEAVFAADSSGVFGLNVCVGEGRKLSIKYDATTSTMSLDRTNCSDFVENATFNKSFPKVLSAPVNAVNGQLRLHLFVDQSSIELFVNDGKVAMTALTYPAQDQTGLQIFSEAGNATLLSLKAWTLKSIWEDVTMKR